MFTGIVQRKGIVRDFARKGGSGRLTIDTGLWDRMPELGESIAINGCCLTAVGIAGGVVSFDLLAETLEKTNLGSLASGSEVNLERSLRVGDSMGGHFVTGHVDGVGAVRRLTPRGQDWIVEIECPPGIMPYLVPKGSVGLDGISLTLVDILPDGFTVHIIPHTWTVTTMSGYRVGTPVNLEADLISKQVVRMLAARGVVQLPPGVELVPVWTPPSS